MRRFVYMNVSKKDILYAFYMILCSSLMALIYNYFSSAGIPVLYQNNTIISDKTDSITAPEIVRYYSSENKSIIIDARSEDLFKEGHIPGALSCPVYDFDENITRLKKQFGLTQNIVVYCSDVHCSDSRTLANKLIKEGYINVRTYPGGFSEWQHKGYPVQKK